MKKPLVWDEAKRLVNLKKLGLDFADSAQVPRNVRSTMTGLKTNAMSRKAVLAAVRAIPPDKDLVWDGQDEDERPASKAELAAGVNAYRRQGRGRPPGADNKVQIAIRIDRGVLAAFRSGGPGWQTRMNDALKEWLKAHA